MLPLDVCQQYSFIRKKKDKRKKENHEWMKLTWRRTRTNIFKWPVIKCYPWRHEWRYIFSIKFIKSIWKGNNFSAINDTLRLNLPWKKKWCLRTIHENRTTADELRIEEIRFRDLFSSLLAFISLDFSSLDSLKANKLSLIYYIFM